MESEQESVFQSSAQVIVDAVMEGFNGMRFCLTHGLKD